MTNCKKYFIKTTFFALFLMLLNSCVPESEYNSLKNKNKELTKVNQQLKNELIDIKAKNYLLSKNSSKNKNVSPYKSTENTDNASVEEFKNRPDGLGSTQGQGYKTSNSTPRTWTITNK